MRRIAPRAAVPSLRRGDLDLPAGHRDRAALAHRQIDMEPALRGRAQLIQRLPQGSAIKCQAVYPTPFWREEGLSGYVNADNGPIRLMYDNTPASGRPGVLLGFIEGHEARVWGARPAAARRAAVLDAFARFIDPRAGPPARFVGADWAQEPWTRGCYVGFTPPGVLLDYGPAIRRPVGADPLGGRRVRDLLERLHGRRRSVGRGGRRRGAAAL